MHLASEEMYSGTEYSQLAAERNLADRDEEVIVAEGMRQESAGHCWWLCHDP